MAGYNTYRDIDYPYLTSSILNNDPVYPNFWRNNPLSSASTIDPRRSGFRPYAQYGVVTKQRPWIDSPCPVWQNSCDLITPSNKCYIRDHQIVPQP